MYGTEALIQFLPYAQELWQPDMEKYVDPCMRVENVVEICFGWGAEPESPMINLLR